MSSAAAAEAEVVAKRRALQDSLSELRDRLRPDKLTADIGSSVSERLAVVSDKVSDKASSPAGLVGLCAMAFASTYALTGGLAASSGAVRKSVKTDTLRPDGKATLQGDTLAMIGQLSAAVAVGAVISRYLPATDAERALLGGVGPELRNILHTEVSRQAELLVSPPSNRFKIVNLVALGGAMLMKRSKLAS